MKNNILFLFFIVAAVQLQCSRATVTYDADGPEIEGVWSYIENDTLYGEVIFTKDHFWEYTEPSGTIYLPYKVEGDTIRFINWNGDIYFSTRFTGVTPDEFFLEREKVRTHYRRLTVPIDTAGILRGDEKVTEDYVSNGLLVRKYDWESQK